MQNDNNDAELNVEEMRAKRRTAEAAFIKFTDNSKYFMSHAFCFYEGEDGKYYDLRIRSRFGRHCLSFAVGNKAEVIKLLKKINYENIYDMVCMMFFVDRDYDDSICGYDEKLFETPCYSIENLYVQEECFQRVLQSEFSINIGDIDYERCIFDYRTRFNEFINCLMEFNALIFYNNKKNRVIDVSFNDVRTSHLVKISVVSIEKSPRYDSEISILKTALNVSDEEISQMVGTIAAKGNFSYNLRGKNLMDFFVAYIISLKDLNCRGGYLSAKRDNVSINITNNRLSELSQYAETPSNLNSFIDLHFKKFSKRLIPYSILQSQEVGSVSSGF